MAREIEYKCTSCGQPQSRSDLIVKKVVFLEMGAGGRTIKSRVIHWLCRVCKSRDVDWNREAFEQPGTPAERFTISA
ncbi:MAG TPA: hypothetical protein VIY48_18235 [Candidatus Paceibacterota bacterium]